MSQRIYPVSMGTRNGWTGDAAETTNLHLKVDDDPDSPTNTNDYLTRSPSTTYQTIDFGAFTGATDPGGNANYKLSLVYLLGSTSFATFNHIDVKLELFEGASLRATLELLSATAGTFTLVTYTLSSGEADSITDFTNLTLKLSARQTPADGNSTNTIQVTAIDFKIPDSGSPMQLLRPPMQGGMRN